MLNEIIVEYPTDTYVVTSFSSLFYFQVTANDTGSQMSGWLQRRSRRSWKRLWFVLKEQVLYVYKASEDVVALDGIPILGYTVEPMKEV